jgi:hypothetical protein
MEALDNIYKNGYRHVTRRVKLTETLNWESLLIPPLLSSCRSTNSPVGVNPHGSTEKVKLLLNSSHLEPPTWRAKCRSGFMTLPPVPLQEQPAVVLLLKGLRSHKVLVIREYGGHEDLRGSGRRSVIPYVHG